MTIMSLAITLAVVFGVGITMVSIATVRRNKPSLVQRIAPQMRSQLATDPAEVTTLTTLGTLSTIAAPVVEAGVRQLNKLNLGNAQLGSRLAQAGSKLTVADYRAQQLVMAVVAAASATTVSIWAAVQYALHP